MKKVTRTHATYKGQYAVTEQLGPCNIVRIKTRERIIESPDCPDLVLGGEINLANSATPIMDELFKHQNVEPDKASLRFLHKGRAEA